MPGRRCSSTCSTRSASGGKGDIEFLKYAFSKLLVNFTWWVNRKDRAGDNVFEGGFLGLDNIGVFDRCAPLPTGGYLDQADGTAWMVFFSQQMLRIAVELALHEPLYEEFVEKFFQHTLCIAGAMDRVGEHHDEMWDEEDGFFYDVLRLPGRHGDAAQGALDRRPAAAGRGRDLRGGHPRRSCRRSASARGSSSSATPSSPPTCTCPRQPGRGRPAHAVDRQRDEAAPHPGAHARRGRVLRPARHPRAVALPPRAPVRLPPRRAGVPRGLRAGRFRHRHVRRQLQLARAGLDADQLPAVHRAAAPVRLLRRRLQGRVPDRLGQHDDAAGGGARNWASGSDRHLPARRDGRRPVYGAAQKFQDDPHWRDLVLFYEYFHGDNGAGIGASHQTGWTGCVARIIQANAVLTKDLLLTPGAEAAAFGRCSRRQLPAKPRDPATRPSEDIVKSYYAHMNLPQPVRAALQTLHAAQGPDGAGHRRQLRHRPRHRALARQGRAPTWSSTTWPSPRTRRPSPRKSAAAGTRAMTAQADVARRSAGAGDVRRRRARVRHHRHPGQQRRHGTERAVPRDDRGAVGRGDERQPARRLPVRARGGARVPAPRRAPRGLGGGRQDHLHQLGARGHSVGRPRQLRGLEGRADAADEEPGAGGAPRSASASIPSRPARSARRSTRPPGRRPRPTRS